MWEILTRSNRSQIVVVCYKLLRSFSTELWLVVPTAMWSHHAGRSMPIFRSNMRPPYWIVFENGWRNFTWCCRKLELCSVESKDDQWMKNRNKCESSLSSNYIYYHGVCLDSWGKQPWWLVSRPRSELGISRTQDRNIIIKQCFHQFAIYEWKR